MHHTTPHQLGLKSKLCLLPRQTGCILQPAVRNCPSSLLPPIGCQCHCITTHQVLSDWRAGPVSGRHCNGLEVDRSQHPALQGCIPTWPTTLVALTGYVEASTPGFPAAIAHADRLVAHMFSGAPHAVAAPLPI